MKVNQNSLTEEFVYDKEALWQHMRYSENNFGYFLFAKPMSTSSLKKEDLLEITPQQRIINFVKDVIKRLATFTQSKKILHSLGVQNPVLSNESAPLMQSMKEDRPTPNYSSFNSTEEDEPENQPGEKHNLLP